MLPFTDASGFRPDGASHVVLEGLVSLSQAAAASTIVQTLRRESRAALRLVFIRAAALQSAAISVSAPSPSKPA